MMSENNGRFLRSANRSRVTLSLAGMSIDGVNVIQTTNGRNSPREAEKIRRIFGRPAADACFRERLSKIARYLDEGRKAEAIFLAMSVEWHRKPFETDDDVAKANFNPDEPRSHGLWSNTDNSASPILEQVQYRGHFHDFVLNDLLRGLERSGSTVLKNIQVFGINGVLAIPDGASRPLGDEPYFIEIKTGFDAEFTANQRNIYRLICIGGHAVSPDPRIRQLGLVPGELLPPMKIMVVHTYGPGLPITTHDYCTDFLE